MRFTLLFAEVFAKDLSKFTRYLLMKASLLSDLALLPHILAYSPCENTVLPPPHDRRKASCACTLGVIGTAKMVACFVC